MAEFTQKEPDLRDPDAIADDTALDKPLAVKALVHRIFLQMEQIQRNPVSDSRVGYSGAA